VLLQTWSAPTKEQEQILALTAQVHQLRIAKVAPKKEKGAPKDSSKGKQDREQKWAWKKVLPKEGEPVTKVVDGKTYNLLLPSPMSKPCYGFSLLLCLTPCPIPMFPSASSLLVLSASNLGSSS
jgi:thiol:disulfide interchange protein